jgi:hypothetical protein
MIPVSIDHKRLIALSTVVATAKRYVNITERHPDFEYWEEKLKDARNVVESLRKVHFRDADENGACEQCNPTAFANAERQKQHDAELAEFDRALAVPFTFDKDRVTATPGPV